ncbi:MAG: tetratricopeptide repeat protein [Bacteroidia bacterium]
MKSSSMFIKCIVVLWTGFLLAINFSIVHAQTPNKRQYQIRFTEIHGEYLGNLKVKDATNNLVAANQYSLGISANVGKEFLSSILEYNYRRVDLSKLNAPNVKKVSVKAYNRKKWRRAKRYFERALKFNPNSPYAKSNLSLAENQIRAEKNKKAQEKKYVKIDKVFLQHINKDIRYQNEQLRTLERNIRGIVPPLNQPKKQFTRGLS